MYERTLIKALAISTLILISACVTESPKEESEYEMMHTEGSEQILESEKKDTKAVEKQGDPIAQIAEQRCKNVEEPITKSEEPECAPEIRIGHATASSINPAEIKFEIEGTNCGTHIIGFQKVVLAGEEEVPPTRGWDEVELLENENGKFILHGEIWSCGFFQNADHIELTAVSENGETAVFRIPITFD